MAFLKSLFLFIASALSITVLTGQSPITWTSGAVMLNEDTQEVVLTAAIAPGWNTYSQFLPNNNGPVPTKITFVPGSHYSLIGTTTESGDITTVFDDIFGMEVTKIKNQGIFRQKIEVIDPTKPIQCSVEFMACDSEMCLPPKVVKFTILLQHTRG